jgi:hypothetical protein
MPSIVMPCIFLGFNLVLSSKLLPYLTLSSGLSPELQFGLCSMYDCLVIPPLYECDLFYEYRLVIVSSLLN